MTANGKLEVRKQMQLKSPARLEQGTPQYADVTPKPRGPPGTPSLML